MYRTAFGLVAAFAVAAFVACSLVNSFDDVKTEPDTSAGGGTNTGTGSNATGTGTGTLTWSGGGGANYCQLWKGECGLGSGCGEEGECCESECSTADCNCSVGCHCLFSCDQPPCKVTCNALNLANTYCEGTVGGTELTCKNNAVCLFNCKGDECHVNCDKAKCIQDCGTLSAGGGAGTPPCSMTCTGATLNTCANGFACGTPCPQ